MGSVSNIILLFISFLFAFGVIMFIVVSSKAQIGGGCGFDDLPPSLRAAIYCIFVAIVLFIVWAIAYFFLFFFTK